jgi:hypothetical protein
VNAIISALDDAEASADAGNSDLQQ